MKTNVVMKSEESRELYGVTIRQETKTNFMSLTDLQEAYAHARVQNGWKEKRLDHVFRDEDNVERIYYVLQSQGLINVQICTFMEMIAEKGIIAVLKEYGVYKTTGRGENKQVMCNPYIWVLTAMELNPQIYAKVVVWLTDKLILNRIEAGNFCKSLNSAILKLDSQDYSRIAMELNKAAFGRHELGIRNTRSEKELEVLYRLEDKIAFAIDNGFVTTTKEVLALIHKQGEILQHSRIG